MKRLFPLVLLCLVLRAAPATAAEPSEVVSNFATSLIKSVSSGDYEALTAEATDDFKASMTPDKFVKAGSALSQRFQSGYDLTYLGTVRREDRADHLWKITFKDGGVELLCTISLSENKLSGLVIQ